MADHDTSLSDDAWLHGNISSVIAILERDGYASLRMLSDEQVTNLWLRFHKNREDLLAFLRFLDIFMPDYLSGKIPKDERLDRFVMIAPILRRDAMVLVE